MQKSGIFTKIKHRFLSVVYFRHLFDSILPQFPRLRQHYFCRFISTDFIRQKREFEIMRCHITTIFAIACIIATIQPTFALTQMCIKTRCAQTGEEPVNNPQNCGTYDIFCYGDNAYKSCTSCKTGYALKEYNTSESSCSYQTTWNNCEAESEVCIKTRCAQTGEEPVNNPQNCGTYDIFCYGDNAYKSCTSCKTGYALKEYNTSESSCSYQTTWNNCEAESEGGEECDGTCDFCLSTFWRDVSANLGYQSRTNATCNTETCVCTHTTEYRCAAGYYGAKPSCRTIINVGTVCSGCTACPDVPDKVDYVDESYRITSDAWDNESIEKCYIDGIGTDNFIADKTGHYTVVGGKCYYSE